MNDLLSLDPLLLGAVLIGVCAVGITSLRTVLAMYAAQTALLGLFAIERGLHREEGMLVLVGVAVVLLKAVAVPTFLGAVARRIGCRRDDGLLIAPPLLMFGTVTATALLVLSGSPSETLPIEVWPSLELVLLGLLFMMTRRMAISQIIGFLILDNGLYMYSVSQAQSMPAIVELGVLVDILVGVMLSGLLAFRINDTFEHVDVTALQELQG